MPNACSYRSETVPVGGRKEAAKSRVAKHEGGPINMSAKGVMAISLVRG